MIDLTLWYAAAAVLFLGGTLGYWVVTRALRRPQEIYVSVDVPFN